MTDTFTAFSISPVPPPGLGVQPPEQFHGIYGMPMFVTVPTADLEASTDFWVRGLGFFVIFSAPGTVVHLRRWAFQDVLLVPAPPADAAGPLGVSFSCVLSQVDEIAAACEEVVPGSTTGPQLRPWGTVEVEITTPERTRVVMTAARPWDPASPEAQTVRDQLGFGAPEE
ncbi:VOC family protein [Isoptericola sp. NEAU-Y5]|uniref:VOC family protein n=1 Tax=Isoptericola luteus TaxID=2879484 RepID=A0ABS7ZC37_9MICO|nr:VOC family protein [Isoptericola sp. NEAU-Y5]MCA5892027.1 VOC family protein [Isoptericola sp. NEAU-Y5]